MDRPLIEIMITVSLLCISSLLISSFAAQSWGVAVTMRELAAEEALRSVHSSALSAALEGNLSGTAVTVIIDFPYEVLINATPPVITASVAGVSREAPSLIEIRGLCSGTVFNITGLQNGTALISPAGTARP